MPPEPLLTQMLLRRLPISIGVLALAACASARPATTARADPAARTAAEVTELAPYVLLHQDSVFLAREVDRPARALSGVEGSKLRPFILQDCQAAEFEFVVDSTGHPAASPMRLLHTNAPSFADAVKRGIVDLRFRPAERAGRKVAQVVRFDTMVARSTNPNGPPEGASAPRC